MLCLRLASGISESLSLSGSAFTVALGAGGFGLGAVGSITASSSTAGRFSTLASSTGAGFLMVAFGAAEAACEFAGGAASLGFCRTDAMRLPRGTSSSLSLSSRKEDFFGTTTTGAVPLCVAVISLATCKQFGADAPGCIEGDPFEHRDAVVAFGKAVTRFSWRCAKGTSSSLSLDIRLNNLFDCQYGNRQAGCQFKTSPLTKNTLSLPCI